jgi:hypothetical protein
MSQKLVRAFLLHPPIAKGTREGKGEEEKGIKLPPCKQTDSHDNTPILMIMAI